MAGSIYLKKSRDQSVRLFVKYLWFTFIVEVIALYALFVYYYNFDYEWFQWIKNSSFASNAWLFNIKSYIDVIVLGWYFISLIRTVNYRKFIKSLIVFYCIFATFYTFYVENTSVLETINYLVEEIVILACTVLYMFELFKSEKVLKFYNSIHFYTALGWFVWYLCVMPIFIFGEFFTQVNRLYHDFRILTILSFNVLLYLWFTYGFYYVLRKQKQLAKNK
ncbi:hypothetical protein D7030_01655 [Flavobacteriaceae bacterium AU392]|nr:hypothetical protein D1817_08130 [Flavobacteriaceae bacterium]RKM85401.1 hypothetical protein D7030_01655 [Flavobacteriaceae bacterium AU392]